MTLTTELEHALAVALDPPAPFHRSIATDADGTLWAMDVGDALFLTVTERDAFVGMGLEKLRMHAIRWLGSNAVVWPGARIAKALFALYESGEIGIDVMCDLEAETVGDRPAAEFDALLDEVAVRAASVVRSDVRAFMQRAHARGVEIHVVTGSLGALVERCLVRAEIPFDRVSGAALVRDGQGSNGHVRAEIAMTSPLFEGKVEALAGGGRWPAAIGMGDGGWDHTFLKACRVPVLIHPKPALIEAMKGVTRSVVVAG